MRGRDPEQEHRGATPLELLFDLTFVVAFSLAGNQAAHMVAAGHIADALLGFSFVVFAVCWAWINFTWFASAFDTDDWFFRAITMVQMVGVLVLALGIAPVFLSIEEGHHLDNRVLVAGYIVMRIGMVAQWLRLAIQDPEHRRTALLYAAATGVAQVGWAALAIASAPWSVLIPSFVVLYAIELGGPLFAERTGGGTPWHPHHVAERYGLLLIITLGEGILGTVTAVAALVSRVGWSVESVLVVVAGTGLTFGLWWIYFLVPAAPVLAEQRTRAWVWGYGHIALFGAVAAMGVGLHVAAYVIEGESELGVAGAVASTVVPVMVAVVLCLAIALFLLRRLEPVHGVLYGVTVAVLAVAMLLPMWGASIGWSLALAMLAPFVVVVGYEVDGHRVVQREIERAEREAEADAA